MISLAKLSSTRSKWRVNLSATVRTVVMSSSVFALSTSFNANAQFIAPGDVAPFEVVYEVGNHLINAGTAKLSLTEKDDLWVYRLSTTPRGIIKLAGKGKINETSTLKLAKVDDKLLIQTHIYSFRQDNERRRAVDATFDWSDNSVTHLYRGEAASTTFDTPVIDRLAATLYIMNALRGDFVSTELQVFDTGRIKTVEFIKEGVEILDTPLGEVETIRVINRNAQGGSRETTTWFAPSLDFVPIKIEHRKRNELVARLNLLRLDNRLTNIKLKPR